MVARAALESVVAAQVTTDATPQIDDLITEVEKQAVALVKQITPAEVAAVEAALPTPKAAWKRHLVSIVERSVSTFAFAFLGLMTVTSMSDPTALKAAAVAGGFSVAVYLRGVAGTYLSNSQDA